MIIVVQAAENTSLECLLLVLLLLVLLIMSVLGFYSEDGCELRTANRSLFFTRWNA